jgi:hypothetical protein
VLFGAPLRLVPANLKHVSAGITQGHITSPCGLLREINKPSLQVRRPRANHAEVGGPPGPPGRTADLH